MMPSAASEKQNRRDYSFSGAALRVTRCKASMRHPAKVTRAPQTRAAGKANRFLDFET
jgi:hypothetical protein